MYRHLDCRHIVATLVTLGHRIRERFPEANLNRVCAELLEVAKESDARIARQRRPNWLLRIGVALLALALVALAVAAATAAVLRFSLEAPKLIEVVQGLDAGVNETILLSVALVFLVSMEGRFKRREALRALHELRCIAHVIDMHQLTKDPEALSPGAQFTPSSPHRTMTRFQLSRYLDYCSELLSLASKLAALHVQYFKDPVVLDAVNDVETLAAGLSHKIWQKIMLLDDAPRTSPRSESIA